MHARRAGLLHLGQRARRVLLAGRAIARPLALLAPCRAFLAGAEQGTPGAHVVDARRVRIREHDEVLERLHRP
eukprot:886921-Pleurochrysis_carterae.AAC.1